MNSTFRSAAALGVLIAIPLVLLVLAVGFGWLLLLAWALSTFAGAAFWPAVVVLLVGSVAGWAMQGIAGIFR